MTEPLVKVLCGESGRQGRCGKLLAVVESAGDGLIRFREVPHASLLEEGGRSACHIVVFKVENVQGDFWCRCPNHSWNAEGALRKLRVDPGQLEDRTLAARKRSKPKAELLFAFAEMARNR